MARQQFEDRFRDSLEQREIKPSTGSWEQLAGRLDASEKKPTPIFWWIGIAATIVGGILIYSLVFTFNSNINSPGMVNAPSEEVFQEKGEGEQEKIMIASEELVEEIVESTNKPSEEKMVQSKTQITKVAAPSQSFIASAETKEVEEEKSLTPVETKTPEELRFRSKLEEVIAEVSANENKDATDAEIDALLYNAAGEISLEQNRDYLTGSIDAGDLLFDVEMELEQSFREKVFDLLKEGYSKARTAVANRSY